MRKDGLQRLRDREAAQYRIQNSYRDPGLTMNKLCKIRKKKLLSQYASQYGDRIDENVHTYGTLIP